MPKPIINEEIYEKARNGLIQLKSKGTVANKLKAIMASYKHGAKKVSEILDVDITSIYKWTIKLDREGYRSLINQAKHQDGIKLKKIHKERIRKWLEKDPNISITDIKEKIKNQFKLLEFFHLLFLFFLLVHIQIFYWETNSSLPHKWDYFYKILKLHLR